MNLKLSKLTRTNICNKQHKKAENFSCSQNINIKPRYKQGGLYPGNKVIRKGKLGFAEFAIVGSAFKIHHKYPPHF